MPPEVEHLDCSNNLLTSFEGCTNVKRTLKCANNKLVSMRGAPCNLSLRDLNLKGNPVSEKTLKTVYKTMKDCKGDYDTALTKIWHRIPQSDQILMYRDNPNLTEKEIRAYEALSKYSKIKYML